MGELIKNKNKLSNTKGQTKCQEKSTRTYEF